MFVVHRLRTRYMRILIANIVPLCLSLVSTAQICPTNIDFEQGNFNHWQCYEGTAEAVGNRNVLDLYPTAPENNRHTMYKTSATTAVDPYGGFPVTCPNGSGYSIRLGNSLAGTQAEGVSYTFTIPQGQDVYSLIYHYAVVFQDPNHEQFQQPRLEIEITNLSDNQTIQCSSFTFFATGTLLPGFFLSPNPRGSTPVWCKDWSAVSVNLNNLAGKTIRLFFKTADCTFRRHFGYAYIDINTECTSEFVGSAYCLDDTAVNLTAPFGYSEYKWYTNDFSRLLGDKQTLHLDPVPAAGTTYAVGVVPFNGYGCADTLFAKLADTLSVNAVAGLDTFSCNFDPVPIGGNAQPGLVYSWSPSTGLSDPTAANPFAAPGVTTRYIVTTNHDGGGCKDRDTVLVRASVIDSTMTYRGSPGYCSDSGDSTILIVKPADEIQWFKDDVPIANATFPEYRATETGLYSAYLHDDDGCTLTTEGIKVAIDDPVAGITYPVEFAIRDESMDLDARSIGDSAIWTPAVALDNPLSYHPAFRGNTDQQYEIILKFASGCVTVDTQLVKVVDKADIFVPNAFTPNNDGLNDLLRPTLMGIRKLNYFRVFNRWGEEIYHTTTKLDGWDGTVNGAPQLSQVFAWVCEAVGADNKIILRKGSTVLVR